MLPDGTDAPLLASRATSIRRRVLGMAAGRGEGYVGQGLGVADIMAALFFGYLRYDPDDPDAEGRDRFVLSAGHYVIALYATLAEAGVLDPALLSSYAVDGDALPASTHHDVPGVESTTGSLAQGLPLATGMALAARLKGQPHRVVVLSSDGEQQEGSTWEAAMFAAHHRLGNLVMLIDLNRTQADGDLGAVLEVEPLAAKWRAFGWRVQEVDGNDLAAVTAALLATEQVTTGQVTTGQVTTGQVTTGQVTTGPPAAAPNAIICRTRLGAGVPLIENKERAHFVRVAEEEWALAALELEATR